METFIMSLDNTCIIMDFYGDLDNTCIIMDFYGDFRYGQSPPFILIENLVLSICFSLHSFL